MNIKFVIFILCVFNGITSIYSQNESISLEDIWEKRTFAEKGIQDFQFSEDSKHYTQQIGSSIIKFEIASGKEVQTVFDASTQAEGKLSGKINSYSFNLGETKLLLKTLSKAVYRHSTLGICYVYDFQSEALIPIHEGNFIMYPSFNPAGDKVAYVYKNNLYVQDIYSKKIIQITKDGESNKIINGASDWVYEEEFKLTKAYAWSPKGDQIAFLRFDESQVPEFYLEYFRNDMYPSPYRFKYPKVGEKNAELSLWNYNLKKKKVKHILFQHAEMSDVYIPRFKWTRDPNSLCVTWINRDQNHVKLLLINTRTKAQKIILEEKNTSYIDIHDNLYFLKTGNQFLWTSEKNGYNHLYLMSIEGKQLSQLTNGKSELTEFYGMDASEKYFFFQRAENDGLQRKIYVSQIGLSNTICLTPENGTHSAVVSQGCKFLIITSSTISSPPEYKIITEKGSVSRILETNSDLQKKLEKYSLSPWEFFKIGNRHGDSLNSLWIRPLDFDASKKYPVLMFLYGGPGSQKVLNQWNSMGYQFWFQMLAEKGYIICVVDNRGTGGRGEEFKKMTYLQLGKLETEDQIDAAKFLSIVPFIEGSRIGIFGWSYGGYMSSLCILKGNNVFKSAIAVAPVTNWKWYDSIYTERFMKRKSENEKGYEENSPINFVDRLKGNYLLVHGMADDNVHFQHSAEMINALVKSKKQFDLFVYPNRHHGISGDHARFHLFEKMTKFVIEKI